MVSFKAEGIILKRRDLGEADRILSVFSKQRGKISVLAKGVRRITSRRSGNVELLNRSILYLHQGKNFWILTEATTIETFQKIKGDLTLSTYAYHILELMDKLTAENQENIILYENLVNVLERLVKNPRQILIRAFEVKILSILGFIDFNSQAYVSTLGVSTQTGKILEDLVTMSWEEIDKIKIAKKEAMELEQVLRIHIERVLEGSLKSRRFLKKI